MLNLDNLNIILFILPVYQMMFYAVQLITLRKRNDPSRRPLGFLMLLMLLYLVINATMYLGYFYLFKYLYMIQLPILLAIIPTYYLYLHAISNSSVGMFSKHPLVYYLPSIFMLLLNVVAFINMSPVQTDFFLSSGGSLSTNKDNAISFAVLVFLLGNAGFIATQVIITPFHYIRMMHKLINVRKNNTTYLPHFQTLWSNVILFSVISFVVLGSLMNFLTPAFNHILSAIFNIGILISGGLAGYFSLKQDKLYIDVASVETEEFKVNDTADIPYNAIHKADNKHAETVSHEEARNIISRLQHHLANDKPYLNGKLGAMDLARKIGTSKQKLTYVINNVMGTNFYGIINKYRVLEAKELLKLPENQNYNIDAISQMVGFQSKSSFNGCFRKITGLTPSEFRKNNGK